MNPPPQPTALPPPPQPTASLIPSQGHNPQLSLSTALSALTSLIDLSATTLRSIPAAAASGLLHCPFNPTHHVAPSSLFSHYLRCPFAVPLSHTLRYPNTLHAPPSEFHLPSSSSSDLCFSIENYFDHNSPVDNFFYKSCPGPVILVNNDHSIRPPPSLTLPKVLYIECANFDKDERDSEEACFPMDNIRLLPSEIWAIQSELEGCSGGTFPTAYSFRVLRAILRLQDCMLLRLREWFVVNSPKCGLIIDFSMRDHMIRLVQLCLKAIIREAFGLAGFLFRDVAMDESSSLSNRKFECPILFDVLMWLASQFDILYGEANGKFFALDVFKECIIESSMNASLFPFEGKDAESGDLNSVKLEMEGHKECSVPMENGKRTENGSICPTVGGSGIFISQVAAAVAALHERSMVEGNIRALRCSQPLSAYQRNMEHAYVSKIADEERQKRSDYRPVIDHDGLFWQRSYNQDTNKIKTREELLAEERDYKRRRMSYRGKKVKRSATEVMRDIIEEYMEDTKRAGGTGGMSKTANEADVSASEYSYRHESSSVVSGSKRNARENKGYESQSRDNKNELDVSYDSEDFMDGVRAQRQGSSWDNSLREFSRNAERVGLYRDDDSRIRERRQSSSHTQEQMDGGKRIDNPEIFGERSSTRSHLSRTSRERNSHRKERVEDDKNNLKGKRYEENREYRDRGKSKTSKDHRKEDMDEYTDRDRSKTNSSRRDSEDNNRYPDGGRRKIHRDLREEYKDIGEHRNRWRSRTDGNNNSYSGIDIEFEDRYDPERKCDISYDDA